MKLNISNFVLPPWLNLKFLFYVLLAVLLSIGACSVIQKIDDPFGLEKRQVEQLQIDNALAKGDAITSKGEIKYANDAIKIREGAVNRNTKIGEIENENSEKLKIAEGSNIVLPDSFISASNDGLCKYDSTPSCPVNKSD